MSRSWALACVVLCLSLRPASAQPYPPPPGVDPLTQPQGYPYGNAGNAQALVASWYERYLRRPMDYAAAGWVNSLNAGQQPSAVLAAILGSREYFLQTGGTPVAFITALYQDLSGNPPLPQQLDYWLGQMRFQSRRSVAYQLLLFFSRSWQTPAPAPYYSYRPSMHYPHYPYYPR